MDANDLRALYEPLTMRHGPPMKNRFALAPMTTHQCEEDGTATDDEVRWLGARAQGGFAAVATCAAHVQEGGKGFWGELGIFSDDHLPGLVRIAAGLRRAGSLGHVELYHGGRRAIAVPGRPLLSASDDAETGARAMTLAEMQQVIGDFASAALRAERAGFDGVMLHAAHGYLISTFLSATYNSRTDEYGGTPHKRQKFLFEIIAAVRAACRSDFQLLVRISPERFGHDLGDMIEVVGRLLDSAQVDCVDLSLWDAFKEPEDARFAGRSLASYFTKLERGDTRLGMAGKLIQPQDFVRCMDQGADYLSLGKSGILYPDYPVRLLADPKFVASWLPVTADYLRQQQVGESFITSLSRYTNFVIDHVPPESLGRFDIDEYLKK